MGSCIAQQQKQSETQILEKHKITTPNIQIQSINYCNQPHLQQKCDDKIKNINTGSLRSQSVPSENTSRQEVHELFFESKARYNSDDKQIGDEPETPNLALPKSELSQKYILEGKYLGESEQVNNTHQLVYSLQCEPQNFLENIKESRSIASREHKITENQNLPITDDNFDDYGLIDWKKQPLQIFNSREQRQFRRKFVQRNFQLIYR